MHRQKSHILGIEFDTLSLSDSCEMVCKKAKGSEPFVVVTPNPEMVMHARKNKHFLDILNSADLVVPDGIGIVLASRLLDGKIKERVAGFDLISAVFAKQRLRAYFLGASPGVAEKAKERAEKKYPMLEVIGFHHGYFKENSPEEANIIKEIELFSPDILLVGLGFGRQETWLIRNKNRLNANVLIGVGGSFDVLSGNLRRAPRFFQKIGMEWFYRLLSQPKRIFRQASLVSFVFAIVCHKLLRR